MKYIITLIFSICFVSLAAAITVNMQPDEKHGIMIPYYQLSYGDSDLNGARYSLLALADDENFPFSSKQQGSVFLKIIDDMTAYSRVKLFLSYKPTQYSRLVEEFEKGNGVEFGALFGVYYKELPYSKNYYVYPAFMTNNVHLITNVQKNLDITKKEDLKNYKGMHIQTDKVSDIVAREFASLNLQTAEDFDKAYEELLTGKVDYIVASYYPSVIAAYSLGVKKYIAYSKEPLWRMPMFVRYHATLKNKPEIDALSEYFKSSHYKNLRDKIFQELVDIYKENSNGVVPPTYIKYTEEENATQSNNEEQTLEN